MHIIKRNKPIFAYAPDHPARQFLEAFIECQKVCGKELEGIDQEWFSEAANRQHRFSSFAYESIAFTIVLDGWLSGEANITESEKHSLNVIQLMTRQMHECKAAAAGDNNLQVIAMCDQVLHMLRLWKECIDFRLKDLK